MSYLSYYEKQLILYTKGHFKKNYIFNDIKFFVSKEYDLNINQVSWNSIYYFIVNIYFKLIEHDCIQKPIQKFVLSLFNSPTDLIDYYSIIEKMITEISFTNTKTLNLGNIDIELYSLLSKE